ncbi:MAG: hypothetical protein WBA45_11625 [Microthrixaceae bacterium]
MSDVPLPRIGAPATRALATIGVTSLTEVTKYSEIRLLALHGFGPKALRVLNEALEQAGLSLQP